MPIVCNWKQVMLAGIFITVFEKKLLNVISSLFIRKLIILPLIILRDRKRLHIAEEIFINFVECRESNQATFEMAKFKLVNTVFWGGIGKNKTRNFLSSGQKQFEFIISPEQCESSI